MDWNPCTIWSLTFVTYNYTLSYANGVTRRWVVQNYSPEHLCVVNSTSENNPTVTGACGGVVHCFCWRDWEPSYSKRAILRFTINTSPCGRAHTLSSIANSNRQSNPEWPTVRHYIVFYHHRGHLCSFCAPLSPWREKKLSKIWSKSANFIVYRRCDSRHCFTADVVCTVLHFATL